MPPILLPHPSDQALMEIDAELTGDHQFLMLAMGDHEDDPELYEGETFMLTRRDAQRLYDLLARFLGTEPDHNDPVPHLRRLQHAANMLSRTEWANGLGWDPSDDYVVAKFREFQMLGRLHVFDDGVLRTAIATYEKQVEEREARAVEAGS